MTLASIAPSALLLRTLLVRGGAFEAKYECWNEGVKLRRFFIANLSPATDDRIILFTATTQIANRRAHHGARADIVLVSLDPKVYDGVVFDSVLDCESPIKRTREVFERGVANREYSPLTTLSDAIMAKVVAAVHQSRTLSQAEKRLVLGQPDRMSAGAACSVVPGTPNDGC